MTQTEATRIRWSGRSRPLPVHRPGFGRSHLVAAAGRQHPPAHEFLRGPTARRGRRIRIQSENLRLGTAIDAFTKPERIVVGTATRTAGRSSRNFSGPRAPIEWMSIEAAEMTKHALNVFLATEIVFANEIGRSASRRADVADVVRALKSILASGSGRIWATEPGTPAGRSSRRDIPRRSDGSARHRSALLSSIGPSNRHQHQWVKRTLVASGRAARSADRIWA